MPTITYSYAPGWNSGARTNVGFSGNGSLSFSVGQVVGVVCGLNSASNGQDYFEIQHGFYITRNRYRIIERGVFKTSYVSFDSEAIFRVERVNRVVKYYIDNILVYISLSNSDGIVFGDCSLFFYLDNIIDATITILSDRNEANIALGLDATGIEGDINYGFAWTGPIQALGEELEVNSASITIGELWAKGIEGDANWGLGYLGNLDVYGVDSLVIPDYNAGSVTLGQIYAFGYEGQIDITEASLTLGEIWAKGVEGDANWGGGSIGEVFAFGYQLNKKYIKASWPEWEADIRSVVAPLYITSTAELTWPARNLSASGEYNSGTARLYWPERNLTAYSGGSAQLTWPERLITIESSVGVVGKVELTWPDRELIAEGFVGGVGLVDLTWPSRTLTAYGSGFIKLTWPEKQLTIVSVLEIVGKINLTRPKWQLTSMGLTGSIGAIELTWPSRVLQSSAIIGGVGSASLQWPELTITAFGSNVLTETTYAINLSTGAVTQLLLGKFDKLVTAHGRLYGLRNGALIYLGGNTDNGNNIPTRIRFAPQQFDTYLAKRLDGVVYLNVREDDGVVLTLIEDETSAWTYEDEFDNSPEMGTHPVKVGRGITFHSLGMVLENMNGGRLTLGGIEIPVIPLTRRPL